MLGPLIVHLLEPLQVQDQGIWRTIQVLTIVFIGPGSDEVLQIWVAWSLRKQYVERYLLPLFKSTEEAASEEFGPRVLP